MDHTSAAIPGTIVVGVDGSESSDHALDWAATQAALEGRPLVVVHTVSESGQVDAWVGTTWVMPSLVDELLAEAVALTDRAAARATSRHPGLEVHTRAVCAEVRSELLSLSSDAAMVVVGSRGRGPWSSAVLGSVSAHLARHAESPLVVCRPGHPGLVRDGVLVAADGTSASLPVIEHGFRQASRRGWPLTVVHCTGDRPSGDEALLLAESVAGFGETFPDVRVTSRVERNLLDAVTGGHHRPYDLVVVGRHAADPTGRRRSHPVATTVLEHVDCAVAIVPVAAARPASTPSVATTG